MASSLTFLSTKYNSQACLQTENLEHFHGTGAFNMTRYPKWDSVLLEMLSKPKATVVAHRTTRRAGGGSGWRGQIGGFNGAAQPRQERKENPHIQEVSSVRCYYI